MNYLELLVRHVKGYFTICQHTVSISRVILISLPKKPIKVKVILGLDKVFYLLPTLLSYFRKDCSRESDFYLGVNLGMIVIKLCNFKFVLLEMNTLYSQMAFSP